MKEIIKYISDDGIEWLTKEDAELRDKLIKIAEELERVYEIDNDWLQVARHLYDYPSILK